MNRKIIFNGIIVIIILLILNVISINSASATKLYLRPGYNLSEEPEPLLKDAFQGFYYDGKTATWDNYSLKGKINGTNYNYKLYLKSQNWFRYVDLKVEIIINGTTVATFSDVAVGPDYMASRETNSSGLDIDTSPGDDVKLKITRVGSNGHGAYGMLAFGNKYESWIEIPDNLRGDLNNNGISADAGDLVLMKLASIDEIMADSRYDLNENGTPADAGDLVLMKRASIAEITL